MAMPLPNELAQLLMGAVGSPGSLEGQSFQGSPYVTGAGPRRGIGGLVGQAGGGPGREIWNLDSSFDPGGPPRQVPHMPADPGVIPIQLPTYQPADHQRLLEQLDPQFNPHLKPLLDLLRGQFQNTPPGDPYQRYLQRNEMFPQQQLKKQQLKKQPQSKTFRQLLLEALQSLNPGSQGLF